MEQIVIASRFCGPPRSGNGGYSCGVLGRRFSGAACVRLHAPPPLERALALSEQPDLIRLLDGDTLIAQARPAELELTPPPPPELDAAQAASRQYIGFHSHPFPTCFVCGPQRTEGDGLRIFPGKLDDGQVAAPWTPASSLADRQARVRPEFLWSALDCTGFFAFAPLPEGAPALLGELTARIERLPQAGEPCIATGWQLGSEGRKRFAGSALFSAAGELLAMARATWIVMPIGAAGAVAPLSPG